MACVAIAFLIACTSSDTYYHRLASEGKQYEIQGFTYSEGEPEPRDYSADGGTYLGTEGLEDDDVIEIPSESLKDAFLATHPEVETPITFSDVRNITRLHLQFRDIDSISGIEYFESLETLILDGNSDLTSVNGIQALPSLEKLSINHTAVRSIDFRNSSDTLKRIEANHTFIDLDLAKLKTILDYYPSLTHLMLMETPTVVERSMLDLLEATREERNVMIQVGYRQIDYSTLSFEDFWTFDPGLSWTNPAIDVRLPRVNGDFDSTDPNPFIDITSGEHSELIHENLENWMDESGIVHVDDPLEKIILLYDYFLDHIETDENATMLINDALDHEPVVETTAYETFALLLRHAGIQANSGEFTRMVSSEEPYIQNLIEINYEGQWYVIILESDAFKPFMIGAPGLHNWVVEDSSLEIPTDYYHSFILARRDLSRDLIESSAQELNIDLTYTD